MKTSKPILILSFAILAGLAAGLALGDSDDEHEGDEHGGGWFAPRADVAPVANAAYQEECGGCHMAYQPGLLPGAAWARIMTPDALAAHYGDDASLPDPLRRDIAAYLESNSAEGASRSRSRAFAVDASLAGGLPRITETRYFRNEHHEIPARLVTGNDQVGSFSNCNACHQGAAEGVYNEDRINIPGVGRWED